MTKIKLGSSEGSCLVVLIIAVGAYGYALYSEISGLKSQISLTSQELEELWEEIGTLKAGNSPNNTMNFTFTWGSKAQDVVDRTFEIQVSVWFQNYTSPWGNATYEMFYIVVRVCDDDYSPNDYLGLVLDMNHNGVIDLGYEDCPQLLYANNSTVYASVLKSEGYLGPAEVPSDRIYTCTYIPEEGYIFGPYHFAKSDVLSKFGNLPAYIPIYICFVDANLYPGVHPVSVQFWVYPHLTGKPESPTYTIQITAVNATVAGEPITVGGKIDPPVGFRVVQIYVRTPSHLTGAVTVTDWDGSFKKKFFTEEEGTYSIWAQIDDNTSNTVQIARAT